MYTCKKVYYKELAYVIMEAEPSQEEPLLVSKSSQGPPEKQKQMEMAYMIVETEKPQCLQLAFWRWGIDSIVPKSESLKVGGQMMDSSLSPSVKADCPSWKIGREKECSSYWACLFY